MFANDKPFGKFADELEKSMPAHFQKVDAESIFDEVMAVKEEEDLDSAEKAGRVTTFLMKRLISRIEDVLNDEEQISHHEVAQQIKTIAEKTEEKDMQKFFKNNTDVDLEQIDVTLPVRI